MIQENKTDSVLNMLIEDCDFTMRLQSSLVANGVQNIGQVVVFSEEQIMGFNYLGKKTFDELRGFLNNNGLKLVGDGDRKPEPEVELKVKEVIARKTKAKVTVKFDTCISHCGIKGREFKKLMLRGFTTVGMLTTHSENSLLSMPGIGFKTVQQIKKYLHANGLSLTDNLTKNALDEIVNGMQLSLPPNSSKSKQVIELWIALNEPSLSKNDYQLMKAKCFLANINRK